MITCIGIDMAMANMGLSVGAIAPNGQIKVYGLKLVSTERHDKMVVRKSSDDLRRAIELKEALAAWCALHSSAKIAFAEVPSGSQSASAARALGIAVGVLASCPIHIIEVSQLEVKMASVGKRTAKKQDMITWATKQWPDAPWLRAHGKATGHLVGDNEHLADACAAIQAGVKTPEFKLLGLMSNHETTSPDHLRSPLRREPKDQLPVGTVAVARRPITARGG